MATGDDSGALALVLDEDGVSTTGGVVVVDVSVSPLAVPSCALLLSAECSRSADEMCMSLSIITDVCDAVAARRTEHERKYETMRCLLARH